MFRPFKAAVLRAGLPKKLRIHDMRHTFAGLFLASGGDIFKLSKILGHSSIAITQKVYAHLHSQAFADDYGRVAFDMPQKAGVVLKLRPVMATPIRSAGPPALRRARARSLPAVRHPRPGIGQRW